MKLTRPEERAVRASITTSVSDVGIIAKEIRAALLEVVEMAGQSDFGAYELGCLKRMVNEALPEEERIK